MYALCMMSVLMSVLMSCVRSNCAFSSNTFDDVAVLTVADVKSLADTLAEDPSNLSCEDFCEVHVVEPAVESYIGFSTEACTLELDLDSFEGASSSLDDGVEIGLVDCVGEASQPGSESYRGCG